MLPIFFKHRVSRVHLSHRESFSHPRPKEELLKSSSEKPSSSLLSSLAFWVGSLNGWSVTNWTGRSEQAREGFGRWVGRDLRDVRSVGEEGRRKRKLKRTILPLQNSESPLVCLSGLSRPVETHTKSTHSRGCTECMQHLHRLTECTYTPPQRRLSLCFSCNRRRKSGSFLSLYQSSRPRISCRLVFSFCVRLRYSASLDTCACHTRICRIFKFSLFM